MFEGDLIEGELEIGQIAGLIQEVKSEGIILEMIADYNAAKK
jgi:enoyl-[acyl-carrier protein] reductase II